MRETPRRESIGITQILLIAGIVGFVIFAAVQLLGHTYSVWETKREQRDARRLEIQRAALAGIQTRRDSVKHEVNRELQRDNARRRDAFASGELKCVQGTVFRRLKNGWENVPGERC